MGAGKAAGVELVRAAGAVEALREVKDAGEIALLRLACEAADAALADSSAGGLRPGRTEKEVGRELESRMSTTAPTGCPSRPSSRPAPNSQSRTIGRPTLVAAGDFVKIEFARWSCGYHSDMTRTFVLASAAQWQRDVYELVAPRSRRPRSAGARSVAARGRRRFAAGHRGRGLRRELRPRVRTRRRTADPRSARNQRLVRRYTACWRCGDRGAVSTADRGGVRIEDTLVVGSRDKPYPSCLPGSPRNWPSSKKE